MNIYERHACNIFEIRLQKRRALVGRLNFLPAGFCRGSGLALDIQTYYTVLCAKAPETQLVTNGVLLGITCRIFVI